MVDTAALNGDTRTLPDAVHLSAANARRIPSPGTQRALKAQTGRSFDELCGENADGADRIQTVIWLELRKTIPELDWGECENIDGIPDEDEVAAAMDPTRRSDSVSSPASAGSGG